MLLKNNYSGLYKYLLTLSGTFLKREQTYVQRRFHLKDSFIGTDMVILSEPIQVCENYHFNGTQF